MSSSDISSSTESSSNFNSDVSFGNIHQVTAPRFGSKTSVERAERENVIPILKSYSTNSSPMKAKLDRDADDDVYMTTLRANVKSMGEFLDNLPNFGVDPFGSTRLEIQGNNRAVDGSKTRPGSVRFTRNVTFCDINDEFPASNQQQTTPLEPLVSSHESGQVSSSEYSATPDTSLQDLKHLQHRTAQQLEYSCVGEQHCFESSSSHSTQLPKSTISVFSPANARTTSTTVSPAYEMSDSTHHLQDDTLSLASKFKDLSLDSVRKYEPQFSLRLCEDDDREKSLLPADDSYEQVDILDQEPPKLPNFKHINHSNVQGSAFLKTNVDTERSSVNWGFEKFLKDLLLLLKDSSPIDDGDWDFKEIIARVHDGVKNLCRKVDLLQGDLGAVETRFSSLQQDISERDHAILKLKDRISHISLKASLLNNDLKTVRLQSAETTKMLASVNQSYSQLKNEMVTSESRARALCENEFFKAINEVCSTLTGKSVNSISDVIAMVEELSTLNNITKKQLEASKLTALNLKFQVQELENQHETTSSEIQELSLELQNKKCKEMELTTALKEEQFSSQQKSQELLQCKAELKVVEASRDSTIAMKEQLEKQIDELQRSNAKLKLNFTELTVKATKMEEVINDQVTLMTSAQTELDTHMKTIVALESANRDSNDKVEELKFQIQEQSQRHEEESKTLCATCDKLGSQVQELEAHIERVEIKRCNSIHLKEDTIKGLRERLVESERRHGQLTLDIRDLRQRLSDRTSDATQLDKKLSTMRTLLRDTRELNGILRAETLRNSVLKHELKRSITELSKAIFKDFDGIIDSGSLTTIRDSLQSIQFHTDVNDDDRDQIEKLNEAVLFIQEAVHLIVNESRLVSRRMSVQSRDSISASNVNELQRIVDVQKGKIKRLETKVMNYESVLKKLSRGMVDENTGPTPFSSTQASEILSQPSCGPRSDYSDGGKVTLRRSSKEDIQKLLFQMANQN